MQPSNLLKIDSLGEGWCDKDHVLLHASFQLLSDFVEKEMPDYPYINWDVSTDMMNSVQKEVQFGPGNKEENVSDTRSVKKEFEELYAWWQEWKKRDTTGTRSTFEEDQADYVKENEMLKRLIDVRMYMWT